MTAAVFRFSDAIESADRAAKRAEYDSWPRLSPEQKASMVTEYRSASFAKDGARVYFSDDERSTYKPQIGWVGYGELSIIQIVDGRSMLARMAGTTVFIRGIGTAGRVDGEDVTFDTPLAIVGTYQYEAAIGGRRTVFAVEPFDIP